MSKFINMQMTDKGVMKMPECIQMACMLAHWCSQNSKVNVIVWKKTCMQSLSETNDNIYCTTDGIYSCHALIKCS